MKYLIFYREIKALGLMLIILKGYVRKLIKVIKVNESIFEVIVAMGITSKHKVKLYSQVYQDLCDSKISEIDLIIKSFEFLLERESNESILREFNLEIIETYFPEYPISIKKTFNWYPELLSKNLFI